MKRYVLLILILAAISLNIHFDRTEVEAAAAESNLIARMNLDEDSGASIYIQNGTLAGGWGTAINSPVSNPSIQANWSNCLEFDNTNYIEFIDNDAFSINGSGTADVPLTIDFWINTSTTGQPVLGKGDSSSNAEYYVRLDSESVIEFNVIDAAGDVLLFYAGAYNLPSNQWAHIAITYFGNAKTNSSAVRIFVNSTSQVVTRGNPVNYDGMSNTNSPFKIGRTWISDNFTGELDEIRLWDSFMSDLEVSELFNDSPYLPYAYPVEVPAETTTEPSTTTTEERLVRRREDAAPSVATSQGLSNIEIGIILSSVVAMGVLGFFAGRSSVIGKRR